MNDSLKKEYDIYFRKFYNEFFKFQTGSKKQLTCTQCSTKKRFIFNQNQLIFSCGPKHSKDKKCGPQYTIDLPKYINFRDLLQIYDKQINGSFNYQKNNILEYDLKNLTEKININDNLEKQILNIKKGNESLKNLINDYIKLNNFNDHIEKLNILSEKRYKNSINKKKIMKKLMNEKLSEEEKIIERKKYAILIQENKEFIDMINELRKPNKNYIMIQEPKITIHNN